MRKTPIRTRTYRRKKSKFKTARAAWLDIRRRNFRGRRLGDFRGVKRKHTARFWVFMVT